MSGETITAIVTATLAVAAGALTVAREWAARGGQRAGIKQLVDILNALPPDSAGRRDLEAHIDAAIRSLVIRESYLRRDPSGIVLAVLLLAGAIGMTVLAVRGSWLWWFSAAGMALFGIVGLTISAPMALRDERGRVIGQAKRRRRQDETSRPRRRPAEARDTTVTQRDENGREPA